TGNPIDMFTLRYFSLGLLLSVVFSAAALGQGLLTAEPDQIRFSKMEDAFAIEVFLDGKPVASKALKGARVVIGNRNYTHQFELALSKSGDATVTIKPDPAEAQVGTYSLVISTKHGDALVAIDMPLDQMPDTLENRAKEKGVTVEEMKAELGLSQESQRETIAVRLPQFQYEGSTFTLRVPTTPGRVFTWKVNGTVVEQGLDKNTLSQVLDTLGDSRIDMEARQGNVVVAQWSGILKVVAYPDMMWQVRAKETFELQAPRGYNVHQWKLDGRDAGRDEVYKHTFKEPGEHIIECIASDPIIGNPGEYRRFIWKTRVLAAKKR
ncbi:MAG TPA: hypothetical protein PLJ47_06635, partial [Candidatus Hydrogenedentes bacterium]|nr:hypothetical protein [Candidatus Hydrogenedentota bacterium]